MLVHHLVSLWCLNVSVSWALMFWWLGVGKLSLFFQEIDFKELSSDDYFCKNNEFSTWLKEEKDVFFSDLSSVSARQLFEDFVKVWNKQKLESKYYEGIASGPRCAHSWKIKGWNAKCKTQNSIRQQSNALFCFLVWYHLGLLLSTERMVMSLKIA